jgi:hypothetical protein
MHHRLISFLKSDSKQILLKYFYFEILSDLDKLINKFRKRTGIFNHSKGGKIDLSGQNSRLFGLHRNSLKFAIGHIRDLHNPQGVLMDAFVDRTFAQVPGQFKGYSVPWIGFIHIPPGVPAWMQSNQTNELIFNSDGWKQSIPHCRGLFTLSNYHRRFLEPMFDFPVENLFHPVDFPDLTWSFERFAANRDKKIVQSGWWLRKVYSIYLLEVKSYRKIVLLKSDAEMERHLRLELENMAGKERINNKIIESVTQVNFLSNVLYDELLSENIVFLDLFDASANNAIIECIARNTPILINPIEPVVEYLGKDYPFYFNSLEEAAIKAENMDLVRETHHYLANHPWKNKLTGSYFRKSFMNSKIYQSL